jgi:dihydrofolate synthase/folylpolyglutamate synthase
LPGRIERLERDPCVLVDGAHTAASAQALASVLRGIERRRTRLVLSISAGKDTASILASLAPLANEITVTRAEPRRSLSPTEVGRAVREVAPDVELRVVPNPQLAVRAAYDGLEAGDCLCVTGSVYLAGIARRILWRPRSASDLGVTRNPAEARGEAD